MGFFGIGPWELLLILILALIIIGPGKIPEIARTLGRTIRAIKKASSDLTANVAREMEAPPSIPSPGQSKEEKTAETPSDTSKPTISSEIDKPSKPGEASATK